MSRAPAATSVAFPLDRMRPGDDGGTAADAMRELASALDGLKNLRK
jgi:hypothetical protein